MYSRDLWLGLSLVVVCHADGPQVDLPNEPVISMSDIFNIHSSCESKIGALDAEIAQTNVLVRTGVQTLEHLDGMFTVGTEDSVEIWDNRWWSAHHTYGIGYGSELLKQVEQDSQWPLDDELKLVTARSTLESLRDYLDEYHKEDQKVFLACGEEAYSSKAYLARQLDPEEPSVLTIRGYTGRSDPSISRPYIYYSPDGTEGFQHRQIWPLRGPPEPAPDPEDRVRDLLENFAEGTSQESPVNLYSSDAGNTVEARAETLVDDGPCAGGPYAITVPTYWKGVEKRQLVLCDALFRHPFRSPEGLKEPKSLYIENYYSTAGVLLHELLHILDPVKYVDRPLLWRAEPERGWLAPYGPARIAGIALNPNSYVTGEEFSFVQDHAKDKVPDEYQASTLGSPEAHMIFCIAALHDTFKFDFGAEKYPWELGVAT